MFLSYAMLNITLNSTKTKKIRWTSNIDNLVMDILQELKSKSKSKFVVSVIFWEPCLYFTSNTEYTARIKLGTLDDPSEPWDCNICCFTGNLWVFLSACYIPIGFPYIIQWFEIDVSIDISLFPKIFLVRFVC